MKVIVTGAGGVLGAAVVDLFAQSGSSVARIDMCWETDRDAGRFSCKNLADADDVGPVLSQAVEWLTGLDALVNIAGGFVWETIQAGAVATWQTMFDTNLKTALNVSTLALPHMDRGAAIINIGAMAAGNAAMGMGAYAASKAAVARLTESLADELKPRGIRVNAVLPMIIDTPRNRTDMPDADFSAWTKPDDIARVIRFLVSDEARAINGAQIPVTNGS
ncbi:hypothetical protein ASE00_13535 [Sphingomonas sp. Root710]|uniref:SDR family oxidoreductase n=1 Tax=Sphingomonas sp. Root710 TaxID=1736594 RepID=UPI0006F5D3A8|nr:SDR family NAD(P)-dependent oxidoreductase [Sphingomonas sp. Root710]KRB83006.1 hypothetical protein ASE00_13535 [Sphingomonas sp. Root710]